MFLSFLQGPGVLKPLKAMDKDGGRAGVAVLLWPPAHCCLLSAVQWMSLTVPPASDSAGKVVEQIPLWEFLQCSGESSEQLHSWEADLVFQLNGKGASLFSLLASNYLPTAFIAALCYLVVFVLAVHVSGCPFLTGYFPEITSIVTVSFSSFHSFSSSR